MAGYRQFLLLLIAVLECQEFVVANPEWKPITSSTPCTTSTVPAMPVWSGQPTKSTRSTISVPSPTWSPPPHKTPPVWAPIDIPSMSSSSSKKSTSKPCTTSTTVLPPSGWTPNASSSYAEIPIIIPETTLVHSSVIGSSVVSSTSTPCTTSTTVLPPSGWTPNASSSYAEISIIIPETTLVHSSVIGSSVVSSTSTPCTTSTTVLPPPGWTPSAAPVHSSSYAEISIIIPETTPSLSVVEPSTSTPCTTSTPLSQETLPATWEASSSLWESLPISASSTSSASSTTEAPPLVWTTFESSSWIISTSTISINTPHTTSQEALPTTWEASSSPWGSLSTSIFSIESASSTVTMPPPVGTTSESSSWTVSINTPVSSQETLPATLETSSSPWEPLSTSTSWTELASSTVEVPLPVWTTSESSSWIVSTSTFHSTPIDIPQTTSVLSQETLPTTLEASSSPWESLATSGSAIISAPSTVEVPLPVWTTSESSSWIVSTSTISINTPHTASVSSQEGLPVASSSPLESLSSSAYWVEPASSTAEVPLPVWTTPESSSWIVSTSTPHTTSATSPLLSTSWSSSAAWSTPTAWGSSWSSESAWSSSTPTHTTLMSVYTSTMVVTVPCKKCIESYTMSTYTSIWTTAATHVPIQSVVINHTLEPSTISTVRVPPTSAYTSASTYTPAPYAAAPTGSWYSYTNSTNTTTPSLDSLTTFDPNSAIGRKAAGGLAVIIGSALAVFFIL